MTVQLKKCCIDCTVTVRLVSDMTTEMHHRDYGDRGSEFIVMHSPLKSRALFVILFGVILTLAFSFGMHLLDRAILAAICVILAVSLLFKLAVKVHSEKLLILPSIGLQVEICYYLGHSHTHFIHLSHIKDIVINEAVTMHSILCYLVVLLKGPDGNGVHALYPLFTHSWPPVSSLRDVYISAQRKLISPNTR